MTRALSVLLLLVLAGCTASVNRRDADPDAPRRETGFLDRVLVSGTDSVRYQVYVPAAYDPSREWPVILFLHGAGERGQDGLVQTQVGIGTAIRRGEEIPAIVVFPQAPTGKNWSGEVADDAMRMLDRTIAEFNGDRNRVYLTGLSMGGYGAFRLAAQHPERFAALVAICGGIVPPGRASSVVGTWPSVVDAPDPYAAAAERLPRIPIWIVHGADDNVVPPTESRQLADALRAIGADVRYIELPGVGHNSWDPAYADDELWRWLFAQRR